MYWDFWEVFWWVEEKICDKCKRLLLWIGLNEKFSGSSFKCLELCSCIGSITIFILVGFFITFGLKMTRKKGEKEAGGEGRRGTGLCMIPYEVQFWAKKL